MKINSLFLKKHIQFIQWILIVGLGGLVTFLIISERGKIDCLEGRNCLLSLNESIKKARSVGHSDTLILNFIQDALNDLVTPPLEKEQGRKEKATNFTLDAIGIIKECQRAHTKMFMPFLEAKCGAPEMVRLYEALDTLKRSKESVDKWKLATIKEISEEINGLEEGVNDYISACTMLIGMMKEPESITESSFEVFISKARGAEGKLMKFGSSWAIRIHQTENHHPSYHIQLSQDQYHLIKKRVGTLFATELEDFQDPEKRKTGDGYFWCVRVIDYAVSKELGLE